MNGAGPNVSVGSKTEVAALRRDVCFDPSERKSSGPVGKSEKCQDRETHAPQQTNDYSITSSARASTDGSIVAEAFAVLRLITSSYLVGACTGRSAGFSPLRMRST